MKWVDIRCPDCGKEHWEEVEEEGGQTPDDEGTIWFVCHDCKCNFMVTVKHDYSKLTEVTNKFYE